MARMHLFIDTNVLLNFYSFSDDDLQDLESLISHIGGDGIAVHVPKHVINELERNRESKLRVAASEFQKALFPEAIPRHMLGTPETEQYLNAVKTAKEARKLLIGNATAHALQRKLNVDLKVAELFTKATHHPEDNVAFALAMERMHKGNPPGKNGSVGDQYNWETLLKTLPDEDLYIVSKDGDFVSPLSDPENTQMIRPLAFLANEWSERKGGAKLYIYAKIRTLLAHYEKVLMAPLIAPVATTQGHPIAVESAPAVEFAKPQPTVEIPEGEAVNWQEEALAAVVESAFGPTTNNEASTQAPSAQQITEKNAAVDKLVDSSSFQMTHSAVAEVAQYRQFLTKDDAERLLTAAGENSQIRWIISDSDVNAFYLELLVNHFGDVDKAILENTIDLLGLAEPQDEDQLKD